MKAKENANHSKKQVVLTTIYIQGKGRKTLPGQANSPLCKLSRHVQNCSAHELMLN